MNLVRCPNGHVYDQEQYQQCPICAQNNPMMNRISASPGYRWQGSSFPNSVNNSGSVPGTKIVNDPQPFYPEPFAPQNGSFHNQPFQQPFAPPQMVPNAGFPQAGNPPAYSFQPRSQPQVNSSNGKTQIYYSKSFSTEPTAGWLVCVLGNDKGKYYSIPTGKASIGRSDSKKYKINLTDEKISRSNPIGTISYIPDEHRFFFTADPTGNLTPYINGTAVLMQAELKDYDELRIGGTVLLFRAFCSERNNWDDTEGRAAAWQ